MTHATIIKWLFLYMISELLKKNLSDFEETRLKIVRPKDESKLRYGGSNDDQGYIFSQRDMVDLIDLYYNSKYEKGNKDKQGYRKLFLNKVKFAQNVAEKQTDVDVANYNFIPDSEEWANLVWFIKRKFIVWTRENDYGQTLNDLNKDFSKYGTCVLRKQGKLVERISLRKLKNSQDATSLKLAPEEGGYVIVEHDMSYHQIKKMPDWDTNNIVKFNGTKKVYEMYSLIEREHLGEEGDQEEQVLAVAYVAPDIERDGDDNPVLFKEQIDEVPFEEAHWDKQDGRWMGVGVVEDLIENQIATNLIENIRRKNLMWSAKKLWQAQEVSDIHNLSVEARDGDVLEVGQRGTIQPVAMESRNVAELQQGRDSWDTNTEQRGFSFEVSTGESLPSGTPFRLGVVLSNSAARHFDLKREYFGLFLYRSFFSQLMPIFKKQTKEHTIAIANGEEEAEFIRDGFIRFNTKTRYDDALLDGNVRTWGEVEEEVKEELRRKPFMFVNVPKGAYDKAKFYMQLDITRQEEDTDATMATLTTLFQTILQRNPQDPRADDILDQIISLTGKNPNKVMGNKEAVRQEVVQGGGAGAGEQNNLQGLMQNQNALPRPQG